MIFTMQEPYYGILLSSMQRIPTEKVQTIGVAVSGNVFRLYYNPKFLEPLSVNTILEVLKHETLHVAFNHFAIWENDNVSEDVRFMMNISCDMEVNGYLNENNLTELKPVFAKNYGLDNYLGAREYFRVLSQQQQQQQSQHAQNPQQPCNGGLGGQNQQQNSQSQSQQQNGNSSQMQGGQPSQDQSQQNNSGSSSQGSGSSSMPREFSEEFTSQFDQFDDHTMWPDEISDAEKEQISQMVDDLVEFAAQEVEKAHGEVPSEMKGRIEKIREKPKPITDWKRYFRRYLGHEFSEFVRKSKKRESLRFPDAAGTRHRRKSHILVGIDTSGSVSMPEYREFFGQIKTLTQAATFHVVECDAKIQHEYDFFRNAPEILHGGGGTSFQPVVDMFNEHRREYDALVYFTDGYAPIPRNTPKDTLWVISSQGDKDRRKYEVNGASVVFIPEKK